MRTAERYLGSAVLFVALGLSPALGYATTHVLLALGALAALLWLAPGQPQAHVPRLARQPATLMFAAAFALLALSALFSGADMLPLAGFASLLFYAPLTRLFAARPSGFDFSTLSLVGACVGLVTALVLHFGLGQPRAGEGFLLTDPFRLAVTTLFCAIFATGTIFNRPRLAWLSLIGLAAALAVIALTGSRTALVGLPVLLLVTALCHLRRPRAIVLALLVIASIGVAMLFVELPGVARLRLWDVLAGIVQGGETGDVAIALRLELYQQGIAQFLSSPVVGHGWGGIMPPILARLSPEQLSWGNLVHLHNDALQFAVAGGVLGLAAWILILLAPLAGYLGLPPAARSRWRLHALLVLFVGYLTLGVPDLIVASPLQLTLYVTLAAAVLGSARPASS